jgi:protein gp37
VADHGTAIEWTQAPGYKGETWNPVTGCDRVSPGCAHCYALDLAARLKGMGQKRYQRDGDPKTSGPGFGLTLHPDKLDEPRRWRKPRMVFVNSMSDLFHEEIPDKFIATVFATMALSPQHIFQVLTKRPERMAGLVPRIPELIETISSRYQPAARVEESTYGWPLPNVWLGVSIESRRFVHRADLLRQTPAAVRFISAEPLLGPLVPDADHMVDGEHEEYELGEAPVYAWRPWSDEGQHPALDLTGIDWLITGGESGPHHRRFDPQWATDLRNICAEDAWEYEGREGHTAFFHKQNGGRTPKAGGRELEWRTYSEWPTALQQATAEAV